MHRIVSMASLFELLGVVNWGDLEGYNARESGVFEYATSKVEIIMMVRELNKRLKVCPLTVEARSGGGDSVAASVRHCRCYKVAQTKL